MSKYHPFYSDDVPFASLSCAVRIASPAPVPWLLGLCCQVRRWGCRECSMDTDLTGPNQPGPEQDQLWSPSMPGSSGQGCLGSMAGRHCLSGHSVHLQVQQILLPLQQLAGGKGQSSYTVSRGSSQHSFHQFHTNCK